MRGSTGGTVHGLALAYQQGPNVQTYGKSRKPRQPSQEEDVANAKNVKT